jgi:hypothetical protein
VPGTAWITLVGLQRPSSVCSSSTSCGNVSAVSGSRLSARSGALVGTGCAAEAQIDAAGIERGQRAELLGDHQRRMVRQHDAAGADADRLGPPATWPMTIEVAALAMPVMLWCSASQKRR